MTRLGLLPLILLACSSGDSSTAGPAEDAAPGESSVFPDGSVTPTTTCKSSGSSGAVQSPKHVRNIKTGETAWFASPAILDLDGDGKKEIVAPHYSTMVFDATGKQLAKMTATKGRVYTGAVVADLDKDGAIDVVVGGNEGTVAAYTWKGGTLAPKWTASTCSAGLCPEARGLAAGDLDGDGKIEVVFTTTQTKPDGAQVFAFAADGKLFQPAGVSWTAWPRYNTQTGTGNDLDFNG